MLIYTCKDETLISSLLIRDKKVDCKEGDDENYNDSMFSSSYHSKLKKYATSVHRYNTYRNDKNPSNTFYPSSSRDCTKCLYEIIDRNENRSVACENETNLQDCEHEKCPNGTFKCHQYYCIYLRYVCDGFWDCPFGYEENMCNKNALHFHSLINRTVKKKLFN